MANHFYSMNRGADSFKHTAITKATSSTSGDDMELRLADAASLTRKDVRLFIERLEQLFAEGGLETTFPPL